jgi:hypothetical protein
METFPPADSFFYDMPRTSSLAKNTLYAIKWGYNHVFAGVGMLDLWNQNQISSLFRIQEPKCLVFVKDNKMLEDIQWWLQPLAKEFEGRVKVYTALKAKASNAWGEFGVTEADLPIAVMHDTETDRKYVKKNVKMSEGSVRGMWESFEMGGSGGDEL